MSLYHYNATVRRVVDGDTVDLDVDLGFSIIARQRFRLYGIDAPEVVGTARAAGLAATAHLQQLLPAGAHVVIDSYKDAKDKYGRYLADIYTASGVTVNAQMVADGHAVYKDY